MIVTDLKQCIYYDSDMEICKYGCGICGTKGKYSYSSECATVLYKSVEQCIKESERENKHSGKEVFRNL
jgi:hypothetical protein